MRDNLYNTNFEAATFTFLVMMYIYLRVKYGNKDRINEALRRLVLSQTFTLFFDVLTSYTISHAAKFPIVLNLTVNSIYFTFIGITSCLIVMYIVSFVSQSRKYWFAVSLAKSILVMYLIVMFINIKTGIVFDFSQHTYRHGPLYSLCYVIPAVYMLMGLSILIFVRRKISRVNFSVMVFLLLYSAIGPIIQALWVPMTLLSNATSSLALFLALLTVVSPNYAELQHRRIELEHLQKGLEEEVIAKTEQVREEEHKNRQLSMQVIDALSVVIDTAIEGQKNHTQTIADLSEKVALKMGFGDEAVQRIYYMASVHDIGFIGIDEEISDKQGVYTPEERLQMQRHTEIGSNILSQIVEISDISAVARSHHERYDGTGYPDRLKGDDIPIEARIVCAADAYDAMISERSYKDMMTRDQAIEELKRCSGTQFDPDVVKALLEVI